MQQVLDALGQIVLRAVPTFILVLLLYVFLKKVFFNPLQALIEQRYQDTEGALKTASETLALAERKTFEHQEAIKEARAEIFRFLETERKQTLEECDQALRRAREQAEQQMQVAREQVRAEVEAAKVHLGTQSDELADSIAHSVLRLKAETAS